MFPAAGKMEMVRAAAHAGIARLSMQSPRSILRRLFVCVFLWFWFYPKRCAELRLACACSGRAGCQGL